MWAAFAALSRHLVVTETPAMERQRQQPLRQAREALGPDRARAAEERGAAMSLDYRGRVRPAADHAGPAAAGVAGPGDAQCPGTGTGHPGRPGPHRRADRRAAVHQHPHRPLAPGPDPGQDRLPPPRRPDPPGPRRRTDLAPARPPARAGPRRLWVFLPRPPRRRERGNPAPAPLWPGRAKLPVRAALGGPFRASGDDHVRTPSPPGTAPARHGPGRAPRGCAGPPRPWPR